MEVEKYVNMNKWDHRITKNTYYAIFVKISFEKRLLRTISPMAKVLQTYIAVDWTDFDIAEL